MTFIFCDILLSLIFIHFKNYFLFFCFFLYFSLSVKGGSTPLSNGWNKPTVPPYPACQAANCEQFCCPAPQESEPGNMGDSSGEVKTENNPSCKHKHIFEIY